jgi:hypothetical protein
MKVVKLNRRFRQFKEHGHTVALRFANGYSDKIRAVEKVCRARLQGGGWLRDHDWYSYYGERNSRHDRDIGRPYWITFRRESDLTLVLLCTDLTKIS